MNLEENKKVCSGGGSEQTFQILAEAGKNIEQVIQQLFCDREHFLNPLLIRILHAAIRTPSLRIV